MTQHTLKGQCHCGDVRFEVDVELDADGRLHGVLDCDCSMCTKKGFLHLIVQPTQFRLLTSMSALCTYTFNTHVAQHRFCARCGVHPFYTPRSHPHDVDINVRCLDFEPERVVIEPFSGKAWEDNIASINPTWSATT